MGKISGGVHSGLQPCGQSRPCTRMGFLPLTLAVVANYFIIKTGPRLRRTTIKVTVTELLFEPPLWRFFYPKNCHVTVCIHHLTTVPQVRT